VAAQWRYRAVAAAVFVALVWVAAALAGFDITRWGSAGFGDGQFSNVRDVAIGPTGTVYTVDQSPGRIQRFTPAGTFLASSEASGGDFIAVDGTGIYLSKIGGGGRVAHLTLAGGTVTQWEVPTPRGIAVKDGFVKFLVAKITKEDLMALQELLGAGKVTPVIDRRYELSEASEALAYLGEGHARGKVVIYRLRLA